MNPAAAASAARAVARSTRATRPTRPKVKLTGFKELDELFKTLEPKLANKLSGKAMRKAAKPVLNAAKAKVPVRSGRLKKSLSVKAMAKKHRHKVGVRVVANKPKDKEGKSKEAYYAHMVEFGTATTPPQPFLIPALNEKREEALAILKTEAMQILNQEWDKQAKELGG